MSMFVSDILYFPAPFTVTKKFLSTYFSNSPTLSYSSALAILWSPKHFYRVTSLAFTGQSQRKIVTLVQSKLVYGKVWTSHTYCMIHLMAYLHKPAVKNHDSKGRQASRQTKNTAMLGKTSLKESSGTTCSMCGKTRQCKENAVHSTQRGWLVLIVLQTVLAHPNAFSGIIK